MSLADQLAEAAAPWRWRKLPPPPGKPFETVGYETDTPKGVARIVRATQKNGKPYRDRWVLQLAGHEVDLGKKAGFDHGDAALAKLLGYRIEDLVERSERPDVARKLWLAFLSKLVKISDLAYSEAFGTSKFTAGKRTDELRDLLRSFCDGSVIAPVEPGRTFSGRTGLGSPVSEGLLAELASNQIDKNWVQGIRRWWSTEAGAAKSYPGRIEKTPYLDARAAMAGGEAAKAALNKLETAFERLRDDLLVNKGLWQPANQAITKDERRGRLSSPKVWKEKVGKELEAAREVISEKRSMIESWIRTIHPDTPDHFGRDAYPEIFKNEDNWNRLVRTFGLLVDEAVDKASKAIDRLLRFLSRMAGEAAKTGEPWEPAGEIVPDVVDVGGAKLIFDPLPPPRHAARMGWGPESWTPLADREEYVRELLKAKALLTKRGFGFLWYGSFHVRPKGSAPENHLGKHLGVAANYPIGRDYVNIFVLNSGLHRTIAHELGHRLWFKFLTPAQRAGFERYFGDVPAVSNYGGLNAEEDFAEVFKDYIDGRDLTRDQAERFKGFAKGKWKMESLSETIADALTEEDKSNDPTVVEYAVQEMMKGKSPSTAAKNTAQRLSGGTNLFIGGGAVSVEIDPKKLESALWDRLADVVAKSIPKYKEGKEHLAIQGTLFHFNQFKMGKPPPAKLVAELRKRVIAKMGRNPFSE